MRIIKSSKTVEVTPKNVSCAKWIPLGHEGYKCSNCDYISDFGRPDFCPKCESDMRSIKASKTYPKYIDRDGYTGTFLRVDPGVDGEEIPIYKFPGGESMVDDVEIARGYDVKASKKVCSSTEKPLTKDEVKDLWDKKSLFIDFGDSDAMCQDNGYTLDQVLEYMDQGYEVYVDACTDVNASTVCGASEEVLGKLFKEAREIVDYFRYHNKNLRKRQEELLMDLSDAVDSGSTVAVREAIENLKYNTKGMTKDQEYYIMDMYDKFCLADGEYQGLGRPTDYYEEPVMESKKLSANDQALQHIKAAIDILGKSGNKDEATKDTIANLGVVMFDLKSQK